MQGAALGAQGNYSTISVGTTVSAAPRTISSAGSRLDGLNERLNSARNTLDAIANQIGGPRPAQAGQIKGDTPPMPDAVSRLNGSADAAHQIMNDIEETLQAIGRALG